LLPRFQVELAQLEAERKMPYVTSVERMGIEKGLQQGRLEGRLEGEAAVLKRLLTRRFGPLPEWVEPRLTQADQMELERWIDRVLDAPSLTGVFMPPA
jgi:predicted transposase YdaD